MILAKKQSYLRVCLHETERMALLCACTVDTPLRSGSYISSGLLTTWTCRRAMEKGGTVSDCRKRPNLLVFFCSKKTSRARNGPVESKLLFLEHMNTMSRTH